MIVLLTTTIALQVVGLTALVICLIDTSRILNQQEEILRRLGIELELIKGPQFDQPNEPAPANESVFVAPDEARFSTDSYLAAASDIELEEKPKR